MISQPFHDSTVASQMLAQISDVAGRCHQVKLMEVCGTHTMEIGRLGLRPLLPENVELISGPGCPVCVTPGTVIDAAAACALEHGAVLCTFGDMVRVPGKSTSFEMAKAAGGTIEVVISPLQTVAMAEAQPENHFVFVAVGFETTIPVVARSIQLAAEKGLTNISFLVSHRLVPPALDALVSKKELNISAFLLPGHASAIIGEKAYANLSRVGVPGIVTGFEPLDILGGIYASLAMLSRGRCEVSNMYSRAVKYEGNPHAMKLIHEVFEPVDALWRGIGMIPDSGLALRESYHRFDACRVFGISIADDAMPEGCSCGSVLLGRIHPNQCPLFARKCTPDSPVGPCMVSSEGSCAAYFKYER